MPDPTADSLAPESLQTLVIPSIEVTAGEAAVGQPFLLLPDRTSRSMN